MKKKIFLTISAALFIVGICLVASRSYPVAFVGWRQISLKDFNNDYSASLYYYGNVLKTYGKSQSLDSSARQELSRLTMAQLIENKLVNLELEKRIGKSDLERMVDAKIREALAGKDVSNEVKTMLGLSLAEFEEIILKPQAEREILEGRLLLENNPPSGGIDGWLKDAENKARVTILLPGFQWKDGEVAAK